MLKCNHFKKQQDDYMDGLLSDEKKALFEQHLKDCPACREEYEWLLETKQALENLEQAPAPARLHASIMAAVRQEQEKEAVRRPFYLRYRVLSPVLCAVVMAFVLRTPALDLLKTAQTPSVETPRVVVHTEQPEASDSVVQNTDEPADAGDSQEVSQPDEENTVRPSENATSYSNVSYTNITNSSANSGTEVQPEEPSGEPAEPVQPSQPDDPAVSPGNQTQQPEETENPSAIIIGPDDPQPQVNYQAEIQQMAYQQYAQNPDDYNKHVLYVKNSALSGVMVFKVGTVSYDYYQQMKEKLDEEDYTEGYVESTAEKAYGDLYMIIAED